MRIFCEKYILDWITAGKAWSLQGQIYLSLFEPIVLYDYNEVTLFSKNLFFLLDRKYLVVPNDCIYITMKTRIINVTKNKTFELHAYRLSSRMIVLNAGFIQNLSIFLVIAHAWTTPSIYEKCSVCFVQTPPDVKIRNVCKTKYVKHIASKPSKICTICHLIRILLV